MRILGRASRLPADLGRLYAACPLSDRLQVALRWRLCPFEAVARFAPLSGRVLDLGCGRGILANLLALRSPARDVRGLDPDPRKIEVARRTIGDRGNVSFALGDAPEAGERYCAVFLVDVLYLLTPSRRRQTLQASREALAGEGVLVVKTMARRPRWKAALDRVEENLAVRALRWTRGETVDPPDPEVLAAELRAMGLRVESLPLDAGFPHPHLLLVARSPKARS